ncbi:uncharacterized protein wu:fi42e03 [Danio rerio]|uniref:Wu:fi42e03 n=1 Tax=Danio rerio TaxID=7955 RepID=F1QPC7_DANRE|nr:uncharacterized protein wu:fi42e03 [Danio rerio]|eukprot:XP_003199543.1 uncharacterized protein wu:fi42e03 [Danio rerio]
MGAATMWILSSLAVLIALSASDVTSVIASSPGSMGSYTGYSAAVKGGYDIGSYSSLAGSSGVSITSEKPSSDSSTRSQLQGSGVVAGSGSLVYGTVGNKASLAVSEYDMNQSTDVQESEVISSSVLMPLQQSSYSVPKPVLLTSQVQTGPQSNSQQPASSGTMAQSVSLQLSQTSGHQLPQPGFQSAVYANRLPHKSGSNTVFGTRPVQNPVFNSKPLTPKKESAPILLYGSMPSSLAMANYELVSQSSGQTASQPSGMQPPHVDISVQPSSQLIQQEVDATVEQATSQQLVQTSQSISQSNDQKPLHGSYVLTAQPSSLTLLKPHKGRPQFGSKPPSSTSPVYKPSSSLVAQSTSQMPVQTTYQSVPQHGLQLPLQAIYQSEAQSASQKPGQTSYLTVPQIVVQPAQIGYQSASQASVPLPVQPGSQWVAQLGLQQPAHVDFSVSLPISQQAGHSTHEYVVEQSGQSHFKPVHSHRVHQIGSSLYSCQELPQHGYQRRFQSPAVTSHTKPVVQSGNQTPTKSKHPKPHTSTLQSILSPAHPSHQSLSLPVYSQALPVEHMYQPVAQSGSETVSLAEYQISPVPGQIVSQPQMLPSSLSLTQSSPSSGMPLQSSFQPLVQSSFETVLPSGFQTSSVVVPSSVQSTSTQALSGPVVSNHGSVFQSVQPELAIPLQVNYQSVTSQNAPGPAPNSKHPSQKLFKLLQQVKS